MSYVTEHKKYSPDVSNRDARIVMTFDAPTDDEIFLFIPTKYPRELKIHLNGEDHGTILGNDTDCIISLGLFEPGDEVIVALTLEDEMVYIANGATYIYYLDSGLFRETMPLLLESNMTVTEYSDTYLEGTVTIADDESVLFTTIPYDEGWVVKVDGEEMPLIKTLNSLLAVDITAGLHTVTFKYQQKWFKIGAILCVSGLMLFAIVIVAEQMFMRRTRKINRMLIDNQTNV
jgi:Predicted membrane protein